MISTPLAGAETPVATTPNSGDSTTAQNEVSIALGKLILIYEKRISGLQEEIIRLRTENDSFRTQLGKTGTGTTVAVPTTPVIPTPTPALNSAVTPAVPTTPVAKTELDKKYDQIMSGTSTNLSDVLRKNNISATGSIGLFEFIEPKNFFISIDDGKNPAGVTAFKTKVLFEYDTAFNLKALGVFDLDYPSGRYVTVYGNNPFAKVARTRVKNPYYAGKLLEESVVATSPALSSGTSSSTVAPTAPAVTTGAGSTVSTTVTLEGIRKSYEKNKLGDVVQMSTVYLVSNPNDVEVLTMRARSQYIFSKFNEALNDIESIYKVQ